MSHRFAQQAVLRDYRFEDSNVSDFISLSAAPRSGCDQCEQLPGLDAGPVERQDLHRILGGRGMRVQGWWSEACLKIGSATMVAVLKTSSHSYMSDKTMSVQPSHLHRMDGVCLHLPPGEGFGVDASEYTASFNVQVPE